MRGYLIIAIVAISTMMAGGCTRGERDEVGRDLGQQVRGAAESARQAAADAALEGKVKSALVTRKGLEETRIDVDANGALVTLKGDVSTRAQAEVAEEVALATEGVEAVNNQLMLRVPAKPEGASAATTTTPRRGS